MKAYSTTTKQTYDSWDDLVAAESNGFLVIAVITGKSKTWPYVAGPYITKEEAEKVRRQTRARWKREQARGRYAHQTYQFFIRPSWKDFA